MAIPRAVFMRTIPILAVLVLNVFSLALLDNIFVLKKKERIIYDSEAEFEQLLEIIHPLQSHLTTLNTRFKNKNDAYIAAAKEYLDKKAPDIIQGDHPWFWIVLKNEKNIIEREYRNSAKLYQFNTWQNCLFSRSFHAPVGRLDIKLTVYYATPRDWPTIAAMVQRYRWYAFLCVFMTWLIYFWLHRKVFRPFLRIGSAIERMIQSEQVSLIPKPGHEVEQAFNRLARNQREVYFGSEIDRIVDSLHALSDDGEVLRRFLESLIEAISQIYPYKQIIIYQHLPDKNQFFQLNGAQEGENAIHSLSDSDISIHLNESNELLIYLHIGDECIGAIRCVVDPDIRCSSHEWLLMAQEIKKQAENGLARAFTRSRTLTEERNRFGINLATNMGHDLTNIIASGKWDLDTIRRSQHLGLVRMEPEKGHFFSEAVDGLQNNLQFLQEMVDIYRSFGYTRRPRYEPTDLESLIEDVTRLFRLSSSKNLTISLHISETIQLVAEPRLLRMALFNLLTNAAQAIQQCDRPIREGKIEVRLNRTDSGNVLITVTDNGPGIRDAQGNPMTPPEVNRIFHAGYSTKKGNSGGGLGLSWVKSIIEDFHQGSIHAANREEGGACFSISIPKRDTAISDGIASASNHQDSRSL
ncbi:MAG: sensor histidine kinase [Candidatus Omnitrophota bacterium]|jgi:signal transduction histidine kinase|nr:MAG: sensor histidine kinase [Candidatus Omnitrophota bacterium]